MPLGVIIKVAAFGRPVFMAIIKVLQAGIRRIWSPYETLEQGAVRGGGLAVFSRVVIKGAYFVKTIVLARLLFPEDFGLFALASVAIAVVDILFQPAFNTALVQQKGDVRPYLNSVWTANILRYSGLGLIIVFLAPFYAGYFEVPEATNLIRALALVVVLTGFENIGIIYIQKDLLFRRKFFLDVSLVVSEVVTVLVAAYFIQSAWALVLGAIGNRVAAVVFSFVFHPYRPKFALTFSHVRHLFKYSKWLWGVAVLSFVMSRADALVIGKFLDVETLGYYQLGLSLALLPAVEVGRVLNTVLFPFFSKIQDDILRLRETLVANIRLVFVVVWPITFGFLALGDEFIRAVYGERWLPMVPIASAAIFLGLTRTFENVVTSFMQGAGKPDVSTKSVALQTVILLALFVPLTKAFGAVGTISALLIASVLAQGVSFYYLKRSFVVPFRSIFSALLFALVPALMMFAAMELFLQATGLPSGLRLLLGVPFGIATYGLALYCFDMVTGKLVTRSLLWLKKNS